MNTNKLKLIIIKFDDISKDYFKKVKQANKKVEKQEFCWKKLYTIRYVFSKLGRLLNLHENEEISKYLAKDNNKLLKKITKINPKFLTDLTEKKIVLINIDSHECEYAKFVHLQFWKDVVTKWKNDIDYATLIRKQAPEIQCRM